eukprot:3094608-Pyramimonas_sp.AAC.1
MVAPPAQPVGQPWHAGRGLLGPKGGHPWEPQRRPVASTLAENRPLTMGTGHRPRHRKPGVSSVERVPRESGWEKKQEGEPSRAILGKDGD